MSWPRPIWLASRSPRRLQLLMEARFNVVLIPPDIDDSNYKPADESPPAWVVSLAYVKAMRGIELIRKQQLRTDNARPGATRAKTPEAVAGTVLGADTVCVVDGEMLGQPMHADDARRMLRRIRNATHQTTTGVCLMSLSDDRRQSFFDSATVRVGNVSDDQIERYVASGEWKGKAGAYNLGERLAAGWPIDVQGDPTTVMGLPMQRLKVILD